MRLNNTQQVEIKLSTDFELDAINAIVTNPGKLDFWEFHTPRSTRLSINFSLSKTNPKTKVR